MDLIPVQYHNIVQRYLQMYPDREEQSELLYNFIASGKITKSRIKDFVKSLYQRKPLWNHEEYIKYNDKVTEEDTFLSTPFAVEEGVLQCSKCQSQKTISYTKQTRRADESTTVFAQCVECGNKWRQ